MQRRDFLAASLLGVVAFTHRTYAVEPANEQSAFYFDNPWNEEETSVLGEIGVLIVHDARVYCQPGEFRRLGLGIYERPFAEMEKRIKENNIVRAIENNFISCDEKGQLITTATLNDNAKWSIQSDGDLTDKLWKKFPSKEPDHYSGFQIEHSVGIQGRKCLTVDSKKQTIELDAGLGKREKVVVQRVVLTDKISDRCFVWRNDYSGK